MAVYLFFAMNGGMGMKRKNCNDCIRQEYLRKMFSEPDDPEGVRMLLISPSNGVRMVCEYDPELKDIFEDDSETIFSLKVPNIYFSCATSDLVYVGKNMYLMGSGVAYKLDPDDDYADMSSDEMAEVCLELFDRIQRVRISEFCFPVLDLTEDTEDEEKK